MIVAISETWLYALGAVMAGVGALLSGVAAIMVARARRRETGPAPRE